jgi:hypothetical protein
MAGIGLSRAEIEAILLEGITDSAQREAIAKVIIKNNEAIERQVAEIVSKNFVNGMKKFGNRF